MFNIRQLIHLVGSQNCQLEPCPGGLSWFLGPQPNPERAPQSCVKNHNTVTCYGCLSRNPFGFSRTVNSTLLKRKYFSLCKNTL